MNKLLSLALLTIVAFSSSCSSSQNKPKDFDDLLNLTDETDQSICSLPLAEIFENIDNNKLQSWITEASNIETIAASIADDYVKQVKIQLRRGALMRRILASENGHNLADTFYSEISHTIEPLKTVKDYHKALNKVSEQLSKQSLLDPNSSEFHMRFCVLNEKRAVLHANHRAFVLEKLNTLEIDNYDNFKKSAQFEMISPDGFREHIMERLLQPKHLNQLTPLSRARVRYEHGILPSDSQLPETFISTLEEEVNAFIEHIETTTFESTAAKLNDMLVMDQMLRKLFSPLQSGKHFNNQDKISEAMAGLGLQIGKADEFNTLTLKSMLRDRDWFRDDKDGEGAADWAWLIVQHADQNPKFQEEALGLIKKSLDKPGVSKSNYAYLYDRVKIKYTDPDNFGKHKQRYGTQGRCVGAGKWEPFPIEAPETVDERRAEMGLRSLSDYKAGFKDICHAAD